MLTFLKFCLNFALKVLVKFCLINVIKQCFKQLSAIEPSSILSMLRDCLTVQKLAKTLIYLTPYVCTEHIFDSRREICSSHIYNSFGTFCVQIGQIFEAQLDFKLSEKFEIDVIYRFQTFFKDSLCLE